MSIVLIKSSNFQIMLFTLSLLLNIHNCDKKSDFAAANLTYYVSGATIIDKYNLGKYVVSIQLNWREIEDIRFGWFHFCGGSIIGKTKILTAAHCLLTQRGQKLRPWEIVVVVGLRNRFERTDATSIKQVREVILHSRYGKARDHQDDVGLVILKEMIEFDSNVGIIKLPDRSPKLNQPCTVMGWGKIFLDGPNSDELGYADLNIYSSAICKAKYFPNFTTGMICAANINRWKSDSCIGDSGGPLICNEKVVGIVSWGYGCGKTGFPGVYADVHHYRDWIETNGQSLHTYNVIIMIFLIKLLT